MAKLTNKIINHIFELQKFFLESMDEATRLEFSIFEQFGETVETLAEE